MRRFGESEEPALREQVAKALFNKARAEAGMGRTSQTIAALKQWAEKHGSFDCEMIAGESDFDRVRTDPAFKRFLKEMGC